MKTVVIFDSLYGNTEKIAHAIGGGIPGEVKVLRISEATASMVESADLLIIGSQTNGGRPTPAIQEFIEGLSEAYLKGKRAAAFDTRLTTKWVKIFSYAANRIADSLKRKGVNLVVPPEGFLVKGTKGPLADGELERAAGWAKRL